MATIPLWRRKCVWKAYSCLRSHGTSIRYRQDGVTRLLVIVAVMFLALRPNSTGNVDQPVLFIPVVTGSAILASAVALMASAAIALIVGKPTLEGKINRQAEENLMWLFAGARVQVKKSCLKVRREELTLSMFEVVVHHVGEFQSEYVMRVGTITVIVDLKKLLISRGQEIKIRSIVLDDFEVVFEQSGRSNSMMSLMEKLSEDQPVPENEGSSATEGAASAETNPEAYPVVWVENMLLKNLQIKIVAGSSVQELPVRIPDLDIPDFMDNTGDVCTANVKRAAMRTMLKRVCDSCHRHLIAVGHPGAKMAEMVSRSVARAKTTVLEMHKGAHAIGSTVKDAAKKEIHHVGDKVHRVGGMFKSVAHAARERLGSS